MKKILVNSTQDLESIANLLDKDLPTYRQAYSDRTSWIMACLSELVYIRFNEPLINKDDSKLIKNISKLLSENQLSSLNKLIDLASYDHEKEKKRLVSDLDIINMNIVETFDSNGTQAMLVENDRFYVLAFRGTEATSIADIKADLNGVTMQCESMGRIHTGFNDAFAEVHIDIYKCIEALDDDKPLFITGHSLGGALATVAAKKLKFKKHGIAACYTYGSPRVGDEEWMGGIKTPIYRIVNSADPVTMLPPGADTINAFSWVIKFIPYIGRSLRKILLAKFGGYYHAGDMRYLTNVSAGSYKDVKVLYHVSFVRRIKAYFLNKIHFTNIPKDHSINIYRKKLHSIAMAKNEN